jgi:DNA polymerase V
VRVCQIMAAKPEAETLKAGEPKLTYPLYITKLPAGFPSPAECAMEERLNLNDLLIQRPAATFFVRVEGDSMIEAGILSGDLLIVDRAAPVRHGCVIVAVLHGEFTVKRLITRDTRPRLDPANPAYRSIPLTGEMDFRVWGVVRYAIHTIQ